MRNDEENDEENYQEKKFLVIVKCYKNPNFK